jgi:serine/threonine protein kinase
MGCPPAMVLERFSEGRLNPKTYQHVVEHLETCERCAAAITPVNPPTDPTVGEADDNAPTQMVQSGPVPVAWPDSVSGSGSGPVSTRKPGEPLKWAAIPLDDPTGGTGAQWAETDQSYEARRIGAGTEQMVMPRGTPLGRYILLEPLGSGGLGVVYAAYDPELDRRVAIKLLRPGVHNMGDGANTDRLLREGQAMARLTHPNVVTVHDVGRVGTEVFIAMELVDGLPLSKWIRRGPHPWRVVRDVMVQAGRGLSAAHASGLVHRDFKPGNVLVTFDNWEKPNGVRVLDFGLARAIQGAEVPPDIRATRQSSLDISNSGERPLLDEDLTHHGTIMGTPQFMAPEQFRLGRVSESADQFAYCVTFWLALYGTRPFETDDILQLPGLAERGMFSDPKDRRGVPQWLHKALKRGMSGDPSARFSTMDALLHEVQRDKRSRRRQWVVLASAIFASAGGAAGLALAMTPEVSVEERSQVDQIVEEAREAASKSFFVYPPPDEPELPTAYRRVLELEELSGGVEATARQRAAELREEFANTLVRLGDQYFDRPGGKAFAADYYAAALIFDAENDRARERTTLTPGEVATLRDKASDAGFSQAELVAAESLAVLAEDDEQVRIKRLATMYERSESPAPSTSARLESLLTDEETEAIAQVVRRKGGKKTRKKSPAPAATPSEPQIPKLEDPAVDKDAAEDETTVEAAAAPAAPKRDRGKSAEIAKDGMKALRSAQLAHAEQLFHKSLGYDKRNATALAGLAEVAFEQGSYERAVKFGRKAVAASPKSGRFRIILGDAYFKTLSYPSAKREYQKAKELGHPRAKSRLDQLAQKTGN